MLRSAGATGCLDSDAPGTHVPPTVDQDPNLPGLDIVVRGVQRRIHHRAFGDPNGPMLVVLPGSASDTRAYLPLQALADEYRVEMWDLPGNGLSERVPADELDYSSQTGSPGGPQTLLAGRHRKFE